MILSVCFVEAEVVVDCFSGIRVVVSNVGHGIHLCVGIVEADVVGRVFCLVAVMSDDGFDIIQAARMCCR